MDAASSLPRSSPLTPSRACRACWGYGTVERYRTSWSKEPTGVVECDACNGTGLEVQS